MESKTISVVGRFCIQCHLCEEICPAKAISFFENEKGFLVPQINNSCVSCGKCLAACPAVRRDKDTTSFGNPTKVFYGSAKQINDQLESASGGVFYAMATAARQLGFDVISTVYSKDFRKCFYGNSDDFTIEQMRQSKYCESDFGGVISKIRQNVTKGKPTLVCGTPCHINSLRSYFGDDENLFLVDFVCHGVPSSKLYRDMVSYYEKKLRGPIVALNFRFKKTKFPTSLCLSVSSPKKQKKILWNEDRFYFGFEKYWILRDSCYSCAFERKHSADITLGDFWHANDYGVKADNKNGCSLIHVNSKKGLWLLNCTNKKIQFSELPGFKGFSAPHKDPNDYNKQVLFFDLYKERGYVNTCDHLFFRKQILKNWLKRILRRV